MRILALLLFAFLYSASSYAAPFTWSVSHQRPAYQPYASGYPSPESACRRAAEVATEQSPTVDNYPGVYTYSSVTRVSDTLFTCALSYRGNSNGSTTLVNLNTTRSGDGCDAGYTFNPQTGSCDAPLDPNGEVCGPKSTTTGLPQIKNASGECVDFIFADKESQCKYAENSVREVSVSVQFDSQGVPHGPPDLSFGGCAAVPVGANPYKNCKQPASRQACYNGVCVEMQGTAAQCSVAVQFTGQTSDGDFGFTGDSGGGEGPCDPDSDCTPDAPPIENDRQPCTYQTDAEGRQSCTSFDYKGVPGESSSCGEFNGQMTCVSKKPPVSNGVQIDTQVETKDNGDGTKTVTKTDTRRDVTCAGAGSCKTEVTKSVNVQHIDGAGNTIGSETKCEGPKCNDGKGKGDGTGTGEGECTVDCEEEGDEFNAPDLEEVPSFGESLENFMSGVQDTPLMTAVSGIGFASGGSCSMGSTNTIIGTISLDYICVNSGWLDPLYFVFLAIWAFAAVRVLMSA